MVIALTPNDTFQRAKAVNLGHIGHNKTTHHITSSCSRASVIFVLLVVLRYTATAILVAVLWAAGWHLWPVEPHRKHRRLRRRRGRRRRCRRCGRPRCSGRCPELRWVEFIIISWLLQVWHAPPRPVVCFVVTEAAEYG